MGSRPLPLSAEQDGWFSPHAPVHLVSERVRAEYVIEGINLTDIGWRAWAGRLKGSQAGSGGAGGPSSDGTGDVVMGEAGGRASAPREMGQERPVPPGGKPAPTWTDLEALLSAAKDSVAGLMGPAPGAPTTPVAHVPGDTSLAGRAALLCDRSGIWAVRPTLQYPSDARYLAISTERCVVGCCRAGIKLPLSRSYHTIRSYVYMCSRGNGHVDQELPAFPWSRA